jgi:hypothetical protein
MPLPFDWGAAAAATWLYPATWRPAPSPPHRPHPSLPRFWALPCAGNVTWKSARHICPTPVSLVLAKQIWPKLNMKTQIKYMAIFKFGCCHQTSGATMWGVCFCFVYAIKYMANLNMVAALRISKPPSWCVLIYYQWHTTQSKGISACGKGLALRLYFIANWNAQTNQPWKDWESSHKSPPCSLDSVMWKAKKSTLSWHWKSLIEARLKAVASKQSTWVKPPKRTWHFLAVIPSAFPPHKHDADQ